MSQEKCDMFISCDLNIDLLTDIGTEIDFKNDFQLGEVFLKCSVNTGFLKQTIFLWML